MSLTERRLGFPPDCVEIKEKKLLIGLSGGRGWGEGASSACPLNLRPLTSPPILPFSAAEIKRRQTEEEAPHTDFFIRRSMAGLTDWIGSSGITAGLSVPAW